MNKFPISATVGLYSWPRDSEEIRKRVAIDFDLTLESVAQQQADQFTGIQPRVPAYRAYNNAVESMIATAKRKVRTTVTSKTPAQQDTQAPELGAMREHK
jgi:hypothetical protein